MVVLLLLEVSQPVAAGHAMSKTDKTNKTKTASAVVEILARKRAEEILAEAGIVTE